MDNQYDPTCGNVITPEGIGKYVRRDAATGLIYVEIEHKYIMAFPAAQCYID